MYLQTLCVVFGSFVLAYAIYRRLTRISISHILGPQSDSFLYGLLPLIFSGKAAAMDLEWYKQFGKVFRVPGPLGHDRLMISDPKALQYIFHTSGYRFPKDRELRPLGVLFAGNGVALAEGISHQRQRKVMHPAFGAPETRAFLPIFNHFASKVANKWKDLISESSDQTAVVDVYKWASRATLDSLGAAAFDYQFESMENDDNVLSRAYQNLLVDTFKSATKAAVLFMSLAKYLPYELLQAIVWRDSRTSHARETYQLSKKVARELVEERAAVALDGESKRDIMSILVKANASADSKMKITEEELLGQLQTLIIAGHDTTANTLSWALYELSRHPEMQSRLRAEIQQLRQTISQGDDHFKAVDFDNMPYLNAVIKETLRFYPVAYNLFRQAAQDDVLPLSDPIVTENGSVIHEIPIPRGQKVIASIMMYNRLPEVFGDDADKFNPDRWQGDAKKSSSLGVFSNLLTFSGGLRGCLGWRFAVLELQAFLVELVGNFEFCSTRASGKIFPAAVSIMAPVVEDEMETGAQLPLKIRVVTEGD